MNALPPGWVEARLDEIAEVRLGRQRSPKNHSGSRMRPYLRAANVTWAGLNLTDVKEMNFTEHESVIYQLRRGDILVAEASGSASEVGKPALWKGEIDSCCFQNTLIRVRSRGALPEYLRYFLLGEAYSGRFGDAAPGVGIHHIGAFRLSAWRIKVPPLSEQERIVAVIDAQISRLNAATAYLDAALRRAVVLRNSVLAEAYASEFQVRRVGDVALLVDGPFGSNLKTSHYVDSGPRVMRLQNIGEGVFRNEEAYITREHYERLVKHSVAPGDIVAASLGENAPRACLVPEWLGPAIVKADCIRIRANADVDPSYLMWALNSPPVRAQAAARIKGIGRPRLGLGGIRELRVSIPSLAEQKEIVKSVETQLSATDALRDNVRIAALRGAALRSAILGRAFRGELVPQDSVDLPAWHLLEADSESARPRPTPNRRSSQ